MAEFCLLETWVRKAAQSSEEEELRVARAKSPALKTVIFHVSLTLQPDLRHLLSGSSHKTNTPLTRGLCSQLQHNHQFRS